LSVLTVAMVLLDMNGHRAVKGQRGFSLIEVVIAIGILGIVAVGVLAALRTATKTQITVDERQTAKNMAESQMEYVKGLPFGAAYAAMAMPGYDGFTATVFADNITTRDANIQKITVVIQRQGRQVMQLANFKVK
jgi:prepilin-type N-terminal cleavage/methylation domain-containing protein